MDLQTPGVRDQSTPVNHYTTGGLSGFWIFLLNLGGVWGRNVYIPEYKSGWMGGRGRT